MRDRAELRDQAVLQLRRRYHRWRMAPMFRAAVSGAMFKREMIEVSHLASYPETDAGGPLQREEALMLYSAVKCIRPKTVVDIGFFQGHSVFNFLRAMDDDAALFSFDNGPSTEVLADRLFSHDRRFTFKLKSQDEIVEADIGVGRKIDMVFLDASHDLELNKRTFEILEPLLADRALIAIHDTGAWARDQILPEAAEFMRERPNNWVSEDEFAHQLDERHFVNWLLEERPEFGQIHLHSRRTLRHGLTLLQAGGPLTV